MRRKPVLLAGAAIWSVIAALLWLGAMTRPWVPAAPFDIIGFLWLITNMPRLMLHALALVCLAPALYCIGRTVTATE